MKLYKDDLELHPDTNDKSLNEVYYIIIETRDAGLDVACVQDFDMYDYSNVVSRYGFNDEIEAISYGRKLAAQNKKMWSGQTGLLDMLD